MVYNFDSSSTSIEQSNDKSNARAIFKAVEKGVEFNNTFDYMSQDLLYDYYKYEFDILDCLETFITSTIKLTEFVNTLFTKYIYKFKFI